MTSLGDAGVTGFAPLSRDVAAQPSTAPRCAICGWPFANDVCEACGARRADVPALEDAAEGILIAAPQPEDFPELKGAFLAWSQKDYPRMVGQCFTALGVNAPASVSLPTGHGWSFHQDSALICLAIDLDRGEIRVESPVVHVPNRQRVPLLRALLELNAQGLGAARFCLRGSIVVLRYADRLENVSPAKLVAAIKEVALRADRYDDVLALTFGAKMIGPEAWRHTNPWMFLGTPVTLRVLQSKPVPRRATSELPVVTNTDERMVEAAKTLLDVIRLGHSLALPLLHAGKLTVVALLHRAIAYRASHLAKEACPDALNFLFTQLHAAYPGFFDAPSPQDAQPPSVEHVERVLDHMLTSRAQVGKHPPPPVPQLKSSFDARALLIKLVAAIEQAPPEPGLRHMLLLGTLCELALRSRITGPMKERVDRMIAQALSAGPGPKSVDDMKALLRRLTE